MRADGMPVASAADEFFNGSLRAPIALRADGMQTPGGVFPWTGYWPEAGTADRCSGWMSNSASQSGQVGAPWSVSTDWVSATSCSCNMARPVFGVGVDPGAPLRATTAEAGRLAFVIPSFRPGMANPSVACQAAGEMVRHGAQFAPLLVTSTGGWLEPFDAGVPWYRADGVEVVSGTGPTRNPFGAPILRAPLNRTTTGTVVSGSAWMGNLTETCMNWTSMSAAGTTFGLGQSDPEANLTGNVACSTPGIGLLCLQK